MGDILAYDPDRTTNAQLMADVARFGWLDGLVLDATYNAGKFWATHRPDGLVTNDLDPQWNTDHSFDWTQPLPSSLAGRFRAVVFDPPYKMQGTPSKAFESMNSSYGVARARTTKDTLADMLAGLVHLSSAVDPDGGMFLVKCQSQQWNARFGSQAAMVAEVMHAVGGFAVVGELHVMGGVRPQSSQVTPRNNCSTLVCLRRDRRARAGAKHPQIVEVAGMMFEQLELEAV